MPQHTTPRQPLSCENCRKRKIKCPGGQVPCATCVRRGHSQSCYYKTSADNPERTNSNESELLYRIRNLEALLKQQIAQSSHSPPVPGLSLSPARSDEAYSYVLSDTASARQRALQSGTIITSAAGYQHFSPRASTLDAPFVHELAESVPSPLCATSFPFTSDQTNTKSALLDMLPPLRQCDELKCVFFKVFSPLFHILHDPTFEAVYDVFRQDPSTVPLSWLALLFVVLAIAVTALEEDHPLLRDLGRESAAAANIKKLSSRYRSAAMQCLTADQFLYQHNVQTVQTLVLLIYAMNHASISSWALLGMTWNIAVRIGCHIDPSRLGLGVVEGEERRRCWAALMMLYTVQNTCMGNIAPQVITSDVELPADKDDDELDNSQLIVSEATEDSPRPSKMSYILYKFRLYKIAAEICQCAIDERLSDQQTIFALDQKLANEEKEHASRFSGQNLPIYHIAHHYILQSYTNHLYLILHRASMNSQNTGDDLVLQSRQRCKMSAITILEAHGYLYDTEVFRPYQWYVHGLGSFHAFLAVSVLIILSLNNTRARDDDDRLQIHTLVEQCVQRFETMANRSDVCARAATILRRALQTGNAAAGPEVDSRHHSPSSLRKEPSFHQYPISPTSEPERFIPSTYDWNSSPELEALLFDMAPQHWMAPSSFIWDHWNNMAVAQNSY